MMTSLLILQEDLTKLTEIDRSLAVFVMATYGEGDPTDNAQGFYDWLKDSATDLTGVRYAVRVLTMNILKL
jgi:NADPH-ferrihemoprotein reductase